MADSLNHTIPLCEGADPNPQAPHFSLPSLACDCHAHIFGPQSECPMVSDRLYTPPEASLPSYEYLLSTLGFDRAVIVQPSVYGTDNRATLDAVATAPDRYRAIVFVDAGVTEDDLAALHAAGARGVRANLLFSGDKAMRDVESITAKIAPFGWHLQVLLDVSTFPDLLQFFSRLPVQTVFDHMGHFPVSKGVDDPGFIALTSLMEQGKAWAKLSGAYRITGEATAPYGDIATVACALIQANSDHVVFGSDWPHPQIQVTMPNDGDLLDALADWAPASDLRRKILFENPARLYGF
ncbi:MAG: amidohydrolase family protein [Pseudomonadota bacterium]